MAYDCAYLVGVTRYVRPDGVPIARTTVTVTECVTNIIDLRPRHDQRRERMLGCRGTGLHTDCRGLRCSGRCDFRRDAERPRDQSRRQATWVLLAARTG